MTAFLLVAASSVSPAGEKAGNSSSLLTWRPVRPRQSFNHGEAQASRTESPDSARQQQAPRIALATRVDPQVKRAALQLSDDPLANPFSDPMPRSPFRASGLQATPAPADEQSDEPAVDPETSATSAQRTPNPFAPQTAQPAEPDASGAPSPMPDGSAPALPRDELGTPPIPPLDPEMEMPDPKKDCETALKVLRSKRLNRETTRAILNLAPLDSGELPYQCSFGTERLALNNGRDWAQTTYTWKASGLCHKPLYFEQAHMERYGHSWGPVLDSVVSGAHFFASVPMLPYKMGLEPPCECIYPLGHYRPGNCAPRYIEPFPWSIRAAAAEATVATGLIFAVP